MPPPYHERQSLMRCLVHALNALVQEPRFTSAKMDAVCEELNKRGGNKWINPHRSVLGLGNYDANVLEFVCTTYIGADVKWLRTDAEVESSRANPDLIGFIVNVPSGGFSGWCGGQHWFCVRSVDGQWYDLDSNRREPCLLEDPTPILRGHLAKARHHVMAVLRLPEESVRADERPAEEEPVHAAEAGG
eukprot:TRINITY_DN35949_c0_g1_i1.p1 TRINITY_DN35949_c0_g1~~TRINITY_DN35949_c0_g1_i1.p1  ORF type:complete len:207 (+),score=58.25 TRINITY_DN35949_c0_g1_i1:55-621(+)